MKASFYNDLASHMMNTSFNDRTRTFPAMKTAAGYKYNFKGKPITPDRITPLSTRNQGIDGLYDILNAATRSRIDSLIMDPLIAAGVDETAIFPSYTAPGITPARSYLRCRPTLTSASRR